MTTTPDKSHSILSPSGADRWSTCLGSLAACKGMPERPPGRAAALGTAKHSVSEYILTSEYPDRGATCVVGQKITVDGFEFEIDDEFADHVQVYLDYVNGRPGAKVLESWVSTAHIFGVPGQGGTVDCKHLNSAAREIEIIDAKFGYVPVSAEHRQLRIYGAACLSLHDLDGEWDTVRCTIVQPQDAAEPVKTAVFTRAEIDAFVADLAPKARKAWELHQSPPANLIDYLTPSESACAWCPVAGTCAARANRIVNMFQDATVTEPDPVLMSDERIAELYAQTADIVEWAQAIAAEAESRALRGATVPGYKLIYGRKGARRYKDGADDAVAGVLGLVLGEADMYAPRKLVSPTAAEAALKKANAPALYEQIAPYVEQADAKLRLVPLATKGDPVTVSKVDFEDVSK